MSRHPSAHTHTHKKCSVLLFFVSYFVFLAAVFVSTKTRRPVLPSLARVIGLPSGLSSVGEGRHKEKKIRVAVSYCTARAPNDDARRYRGNFVTDNSHGDIIGPSPINGELSSCSGSPRISSPRRTHDPYPYTRTLIARTLGLLFCTPVQLGGSTRFCRDKIKAINSIFAKFEFLA